MVVASALPAGLSRSCLLGAMREASALVHISCGYHSLLRCMMYYATTHGGLQR